MGDKIRVIVTEDNFSTRTGIRDYLIGLGMEVMEASTSTETLQGVAEWAPQVVVLDIAIPSRPGENADWRDIEGIRVAKLIKEHNPRIGIVLYSSYPYHRGEVLELADLGYGGLVYLFKGAGPPEELRDAIYQAMEGRVVLDPEVTQGKLYPPDGSSRLLADQAQERVEYAVSQMGELTDREWEVTQKVAALLTNAGIAKDLGITLAAVQTHLYHIYDKLGLGKGVEEDLVDKRALLTRACQIYRSRHARERR